MKVAGQTQLSYLVFKNSYKQTNRHFKKVNTIIKTAYDKEIINCNPRI